MINRLRMFFRLRKQNDAVKIVFVLVLAAIACLISAGYHIGGICRYVNSPVEYVLMGDNVISQNRVEELLQNKEVAQVSRQMDIPVTLMYRGAKTVVTCTMLSEDYIKEQFDLGSFANMKTIYMNGAAYSELQHSLWENNESTPDMPNQSLEKGKGMELDIRYCLGEECSAFDDANDAAAPQYKTARLIMKNDGEQEEGIAYIAEADNRLQKEAVNLRVRFKKHDLDGLQVSNLRKMGYSIENEAMLMEEEYKVKIKLLHIQYGLLCFAVCAVGAGTLWRLVKRWF